MVIAPADCPLTNTVVKRAAKNAASTDNAITWNDRHQAAISRATTNRHRVHCHAFDGVDPQRPAWHPAAQAPAPMVASDTPRSPARQRGRSKTPTGTRSTPRYRCRPATNTSYGRSRRTPGRAPPPPTVPPITTSAQRHLGDQPTVSFRCSGDGAGIAHGSRCRTAPLTEVVDWPPAAKRKRRNWIVTS